MPTTAEKSEADVLRALRSRYERDGYTFVIHPTSELVPEFLGNYRPDALALSEQGSVVIEVKARRGSETDMRLSQVASRVSQHPNWKFEVYYAGDFLRPIYERPRKAALRQLVQQFADLQKASFPTAAFIVGWAALEAFARALYTGDDNGVRPMIPSEIIEALAQSGYISSASARRLRNTIKTRNAAVHGVPEVAVEPEDMLVLQETLQSLAAKLDKVE